LDIINNLFNNITKIYNNTKRANIHQRTLALIDVAAYSIMASRKNISNGKIIELVKKI
jgi:hypothetical protein